MLVYLNIFDLKKTRFHQPAGKRKKVGESEQKTKKSSVRKGPKPTDWRSGPAQFW